MTVTDLLFRFAVMAVVVAVLAFIACALTTPACSCPHPSKWPLRIELKWCWYDLWIGAYIDRPNRIVYICPLPTVVIKITIDPPGA